MTSDLPMRLSGLLLHVTSLPGPYGMGDFGPAAYRFVDALERAGQRLWQVLPLVPPGYGHSPYSSPSTFALSPLLISPERLREDGLLTKKELAGAPSFPEDHVEWDAVIPFRMALLEKAFARFETSKASPWHGRLAAFLKAEAHWLDDYALYAALAEVNGDVSWTDWPEPLRDRHPEALDEARNTHAAAIRRHAFYQCLAEYQWRDLHAYARERRISILGDLPIYVAHDSADVWSARHLFKLTPTGQPFVVSGAPPDSFTPIGQKWGNPLYWWHQPPFADWRPPQEMHDVYLRVPLPEAHKVAYAWIDDPAVQTEIARGALNPFALDWWTRRMARALHLADVVRLDHFRGFAAYWEVPAEAPTAQSGYWMPGPGRPLFDVLKDRLGPLPVVAEDLGIITPDVRRIMQECGFPGMRVLQFGFPENEHHPDHYDPFTVAYSGTHDNDTLVGWLTDPARVLSANAARAWADARDGEYRPFLTHLLDSRASLVILPVQDVLELGPDARMNRPGEGSGQWAWRLRDGLLTDDALGWLLEATERAGRATDDVSQTS
ncbi:MAG TPA: 4-alpha-glucanotransferase [Rhodothermales bacterium]|nr:4-alpha-glucanotransferase [Rhodothermales bacterium]